MSIGVFTSLWHFKGLMSIRMMLYMLGEREAICIVPICEDLVSKYFTVNPILIIS